VFFFDLASCAHADVSASLQHFVRQIGNENATTFVIATVAAEAHLNFDVFPDLVRAEVDLFRFAVFVILVKTVADATFHFSCVYIFEY
jgi:hypothetical protein